MGTICLPFAYLKLVFHSLVSIGRYRGRAKCLRVVIFLLNLSLGALILSVRLLVDIGFLLYDDFKLTPLGEQPQFKGIDLHIDVLRLLQEIL